MCKRDFLRTAKVGKLAKKTLPLINNTQCTLLKPSITMFWCTRSLTRCVYMCERESFAAAASTATILSHMVSYMDIGITH